MAYRLIIADDEEHIREGLNDLVDWAKLGFQVVAKLEDGRDIINWIQLQPADVILTDIKMSSVSGLEVACHVYERRLPTKIVLISGYQEFELAKQAVSYNVVDYLLKPTKLDEISRVFTEVKRKLDEEHAANEHLARLQKLQAEAASIAVSVSVSAAKSLSEEAPAFPSERSRLLWTEKQRKFLSYVNADNYEILTAQYEALLEEAVQEDIPLRAMHSMLIELFSLLWRKLNEREIRIESMTGGSFNYDMILGLDSLTACKSWGSQQLLHIAGQVENSLSSGPSALIHKAKEYAALHFDKDISLKAAADYVYLSPDYFSRLFKQYTGINFTDYIIELRMNKAMEYLKNPQFKVYEIGAIIGYRNTKYFFKLFKKQTGYTPSEYRRKLGPGKSPEESL
ncbi:response regulator transcription factor [Paenibacillus eucommiae]|uniref:Two-component system response regulator YesN n=1 Tax=Paenibacillus eucommiae TaxID=1355755 RepID=A0ABS4IV84_9BACL|nr:helix-turn-helix domain-containing protein [Paenibacillus eucommiae]MBP1990746.1 two-component system response regulator YesN [Paenibacillus eucommiae]